MARRFGHAASSRATSGAASSSCSRLSSIEQQALVGDVGRNGLLTGLAGCSRKPSDWAIVAASRAGSRSGARSQKNTPPGNPSSDSAPTWSASRVLPVPPGPVSVTSRPAAEQARQLVEFAFATEQRRGLLGQVREVPVQRLERREAPLQAFAAELEQALRHRQILEAMLAQVHAATARRRARPPSRGRRRDHDLLAVSAGHHASTLMQRQADVSLGRP